MKLTYLLSIILFISIISCDKEIDAPIEIEETATDETSCDTCTERFMESFSTVSAKTRLTIVNQGFTSRNTISQVFNYKLTPAAEADGAYFYKIQRKVKCYYDIGAYEIDFEDSPGFYRYDYENRKAYHYANLTDESPVLLMDFNHEIGDSIVIGERAGEPIVFVVFEKETFLLDGYPMPKLKGHISVQTLDCYADEDLIENETVLTPYYPNPV
ncbi:MAG: hypothetical protein GQ574_13315 [Crocinitomix sp.]|nr:hypothetical protein [Crocinitomix sp.]